MMTSTVEARQGVRVRPEVTDQGVRGAGGALLSVR